MAKGERSELTHVEQDNLNTATIERETRRGIERALQELRGSLERAVTNTKANVIIESQQAYLSKLRIAIATLERIKNAPLGSASVG